MLGLTVFLFVAFLMLFLGSIVFVHDPKSRVNRLFFALVVFSVIWMILNYMENVEAFPVGARSFFLKADFSAAMLGAGFILLFVMSFIDRAVASRTLVLSFLPAAILSALSFSPWLLPKTFIADTGEIRFTEGILFFFYAPVLIAYFVLPIIMLLRQRRRAAPAQRAQLTSIRSEEHTSELQS